MMTWIAMYLLVGVLATLYYRFNVVEEPMPVVIWFAWIVAWPIVLFSLVEI